MNFWAGVAVSTVGLWIIFQFFDVIPLIISRLRALNVASGSAGGRALVSSPMMDGRADTAARAAASPVWV